MAGTTRGIVNSNPGNVRKSKDAWQGLADIQSDKSFFTFKSPVWGIRAIARILITYQDEHGCKTTLDFISRWAPRSDMNDTKAYIKDVCDRCNKDPMTPLNVHTYADLMPLVVSIIWHENGQQPYPAAVIDEALKLAGVVPEHSASTAVEMAKDPKVIATTIAATAASVQGAVSSVSSIWDTLNTMFDPRVLVWGCVAVVLAFTAYFVIEKISRRKMGL